MAEKQLNTRVIQKHDIAENWAKAVNFIPRQGEIIVYDIDDNFDYERFKIGDGVAVVDQLPFANVVDWNENDPNAASYINNRTHWEENGIVHKIDPKFLPDDISIDTSTLVPITRTINGKTLEDDITLNASDIGIDYPVKSVNGKTGAVVLSASDVGALPSNTKIPSIAGLATETYVDDKIEDVNNSIATLVGAQIVAITDEEIDDICTSTLYFDNPIVDDITGKNYILYVSGGELKMTEAI